ncbi:MAG: hypothetical protein KGH61_00910 [Candidatus Micrarchaeota archaeon]|nr:hypothetical protein [Candidatus Micrarchaeota archaeon]MDE1863870.1 hypothetical protein [Candidatus Micrarchaeota archaeon]
MRLLVMLVFLVGMTTTVLAAIGSGSNGGGGNPSTATGAQVGTLTSQLCGIVNGVRTIIGVLALVMFLVGGVLYSAAHFMPAAGQIKANMQGWSMGMILGAVVGVILVILAPIIVNHLISFDSSITTVAC